MAILISFLLILIAFLTFGPVTVFKVTGWALVIILALIIVCLPFVKYQTSRAEVEDARIAVRLKKANLKDATEEEQQYAVLKSRHEAKYTSTTSIRRLFGKDF